MNTLLLIDAHSLIHRCFHALPPLTAPDGRPVQALYGLATVLMKIMQEDKPTYAAALFDRPEPTFRKERYTAYKAQRPPAPDGLIAQLIEARKLFIAFGIPVFEKPGFEADDLIATCAERFGGTPDLIVVVLTGDMDTLQLVKDDRVVVRAMRRGVSDTVIYNEAAVIERYGLSPSQMTSYKALVGDPSDNIKGVPGIGPKTATELLKQHDSLENLYAHLDNVPRQAEKLKTFREQAELSKELVTLMRDVPLEIDSLEALKLEEGDLKVRAYFAELGFERLIARLDNGGANKEPPPAKPRQATMF